MPGLHFQKLDLHIHTPASKCYKHKDHTPDQIVQAALNAKLSAIAITDHNAAEWIDRMKEAAKDTDLVIFPGVEISMNEGYHLVALFDPSVDRRHVEGFLNAIDITPENFGKQDALCKESVYNVVNKIHEREGLAILAHIDTNKGVFFEQVQHKDDGKIRVPINVSKLLNEAEFDAVECTDGRLPDGFDEAHQINRFPAFYQASDNPDPENPIKHSCDGVGTLYSWFKLDQIDLEGLRLCFSDPEVRIRVMDDYKEVGYPKIVSMKVGNQGFLRNQQFDFHEGLNSIIGGKGVGKSLVVEFLRFGLCQPSEDTSLQKDHQKKLALRLEPENTVEIVYQTAEGIQYKIEHQLIDVYRDGRLESESTCINLETGDVYEGDYPTMFPVLAYSQTEVIKITEDKNAQLKLIDLLIDRRPFEKEIVDIQAKLAENDQRFSTAILAKGELDRVQTDINTFTAQIKAIDKSLDNPLFDAMKQAEAKEDILNNRYEYISCLIEQAKTWQNEVEELADLPEEYKEDEIVVQVQQFADSARSHTNKSIKELVGKLGESKKSTSDVIMGWMPESEKIEAEYKALLDEIGGDRNAKERERKQLVKQLKELNAEAKEYQKRIENLEDIIVERNAFLDSLARAYREYFEVRKAKFDHITELSGGKLQLILEHAVDRTAYEELLVDLLKGGGGNAINVTTRKKIAQNAAPRRLVQLVLDKNIPHLANETEISELWAERVIERMWSVDDFTQVLALQHNCYPADEPYIRYCKEGGVFGELSELSVGQKCTALLIIALCDGSMPVVIDQPEDALDIASVWEDVAKKLRHGKDSRQFILTTHNSTVAVGSDSDQFIVLKAGATAGKVVHVGAIDRQDVRQSVIDHLEGGDEPYRIRADKYNLN